MLSLWRSISLEEWKGIYANAVEKSVKIESCRGESLSFKIKVFNVMKEFQVGIGHNRFGLENQFIHSVKTIDKVYID